MIQIILLCYLFVIVVFAIASLVDTARGNSFAISPVELAELNDLNLFGGVLLSLLFFILNPLYYIACFSYWLLHWHPFDDHE